MDPQAAHRRLDALVADRRLLIDVERATHLPVGVVQSRHLESGNLTSYSPLAAATGQSWSDLFSPSQFVATSDRYTITSFVFTPPGAGDTGGGVSLSVAAVPEPSTWASMAIGLLCLGTLAGRRQRLGRRA